jgi:hypothetical protein
VIIGLWHLRRIQSENLKFESVRSFWIRCLEKEIILCFRNINLKVWNENCGMVSWTWYLLIQQKLLIFFSTWLKAFSEIKFVLTLAVFQFRGAFLFSPRAGYVFPREIESWSPFHVNCWFLVLWGPTECSRPLEDNMHIKLPLVLNFANFCLKDKCNGVIK